MSHMGRSKSNYSARSSDQFDQSNHGWDSFNPVYAPSAYGYTDPYLQGYYSAYDPNYSFAQEKFPVPQYNPYYFQGELGQSMPDNFSVYGEQYGAQEY
jgi:hypothetical protein